MKRQTFFPITAVLLSLMITLICLELGLRYHYNSKGFTLKRQLGYLRDVPFGQTWLNPNLDDQFLWNDTFHHVRTNNLGFRMEENIAFGPPSNGTLRVVCMGASTTFSVGVDQEDLFSVLLQNKIKNIHQDSEVINAGVPGHNSPNILTNFNFRILPLKPHVLILYCGNNDLASSYAPDFNPMFEHVKLESNGKKPWWAKYSALGVFIDGRLSYLKNLKRSEAIVDTAKRTKNLRRALEGFERNITSIIHIAEANKIKVVLVTFTCSTKRDITYYHSTNAILRELARKYNSLLIDMEVSFPRNDDNFIDAMHFSAKGEKIRAELIWTELQPLVYEFVNKIKWKL